MWLWSGDRKRRADLTASKQSALHGADFADSHAAAVQASEASSPIPLDPTSIDVTGVSVSTSASAKACDEGPGKAVSAQFRNLFEPSLEARCAQVVAGHTQLAEAFFALGRGDGLRNARKNDVPDTRLTNRSCLAKCTRQAVLVGSEVRQSRDAQDRLQGLHAMLSECMHLKSACETGSSRASELALSAPTKHQNNK